VLVLCRKVGDKVLVPQYDIVIQVLEVRGNSVRVGIDAPGDVKVYRAEVWERMHRPRPADEAVVGD
jgi:carbon storage regulator